MHHPACPAPGLGVRSPRRVPSWAESREDAWSHGGGAGPVGRAGPGPGVVAGLQRAHFLPMLLEGAVIWPSLPQPGLLTQQPQGGGETGFLDKKNPSPGHPWPRFLLRRWEVEPWVLSGFPAGGWGAGGAGAGSGPWGRALSPSPPSRTALPWAPPSVGPQCPQDVVLAAAWLCSPVTPALGRLVLRSHACPVLRVLHTFPLSQVSACVHPPPGSPPGLGSLPSRPWCQRPIPWKKRRARPRSPPQHQCWPGSQTATPGALGQAEGQGLVFTEPVGFGCLNGRALCLVE